jgi:type III secretory pathway component EscR
LGIVYISLYPTELVIKKKDPQKESYSEEQLESETGEEVYQQKEENLITYKGTLEPNGENDKETFYRCRLKLQKKKEEVKVKDDGSSGLIIFLVLLFGGLIAFVIFKQGS